MEIIKKLFNKRSVLFIVIIYLCIKTYTYAVVYNSDAFKCFCNYAKTNEEFIDKYGRSHGCRLALFNYNMNTLGNSGRAEFGTTVDTNKGKYEFRVQLNKSNGVWSVYKIYE